MLTVSVIAPNYNHAPFLKQRIDSILEQTYQDFELILLDDCSTDNSRDIMEQYRCNPHVSHIVYNTVNGGSAFRQWKKGIDLAKGEWVWIAESDDWAEPSFLKEMLGEAEKLPSCCIVASTPIYVYPDGSTWNNKTTDNPRLINGVDFARQHLLNGNSLPNASALLIRRDVLNQIDFSSIVKMRLCGDWLLYAQCCYLGDVLLTDKTLSYFRQHGNNTSSAAERQGLNFIEGIEVLNYIKQHFHVQTKNYARCWGRTWAKLERKHHYSKLIRSTVANSLKHHPAISLWHIIYRFKLAL